MKLRLSVTTGLHAFSEHRESHEFTELGGTIGRSSRNDWVIPDPTRVVSGTHAQIDFVDGQFQLTDTSTNGVYVNGSDLALGRDNSIPLATGDRFQIGDFEIAVTVEDDSAEHETAEQLDTGLPPWPIEDAGDTPSPVLPDDFGQQPSDWSGSESDQVPDVYGNLADLGSIGAGFGAAASGSAEWDFSDLDLKPSATGTESDQAPSDRLPEGIWPDSTSGEQAGAGLDQAPAGSQAQPQARPIETPSTWPESGPPATDQPSTGPRAQTPPSTRSAPSYDVGAPGQSGASFPPSHPTEPPGEPLAVETPEEPPTSVPLDFELPDLMEPDGAPATPSRQPSAGPSSGPNAADEAFDSDDTAPYGLDDSAAAQPDQQPGPWAAQPQTPAGAPVGATPPGHGPAPDGPTPALRTYPVRPQPAAQGPGAAPVTPPRYPPSAQPPSGAGPSRPTAAAGGAVPSASPTPRHPTPHPEPQPPRAAATSAPATGAAGMEAALAAFLQGAGVPGLHVPHGASPETFRAIGELLALYAGGSAELLRLIGNIKNTFRIDQTQIRQRDNNPLRWVASPREAVRRLLAPEDDGYLAPKKAVSDAMASIKAHQMGSIYGMQEAFKAFLRELEPKELESSFDRQGRPGPLTNKHAWYWARYADYHRRLLEDARNNVLDLIGTTFSTAYERQVQNVRKQHDGRG